MSMKRFVDSSGGGAFSLNSSFWTCLSNKKCHNCDMKCHKKFGFTLAEVLITLGIIGVVAALVIPSFV